MSIIDFPPPPQPVGTIHASGGINWRWDGAKWVAGAVAATQITGDGVWSPTIGASVALGGNVVTVAAAAFTAADVGKRFTMLRGGSPVSFASVRGVTNRGVGYRAGDVINIAGINANIWSVTAVAAAIVNGGSGGPPNTAFIVKGLFPGRRGRRDAARITVRTDAAGVVPTDGTGIVRIDKGGAYINPAFDGVETGFDTGDFPEFTGLTMTLTLGVMDVRRQATGFYGRITGTTLTVEEIIYGTIMVGQSLSGIEVIEGTTITAVGPAPLPGEFQTYTISNAHADMDANIWLFVSETRTTTTNPTEGNFSPTGGSGTGLSILPRWRGVPLVGNIIEVLTPTQIRLDVTAASVATNVGYCYGTDHGPAIQAALDAGQEVNLPDGVVCHSTPLVLRDGSRLIGKSSALGDNANTVLAYVGSPSSRGKQLSADEEAGAGRIGGMVVGEFLLWGSNLIGIGFFMRGAGGNQIRPMSINGHTYIGMQLSGGALGASVGNIHSHLVIREDDAPGSDVTGVYIGPGALNPSDPNELGYHDVCRTFFPYWQVDVDPSGFGRPVWYRVADSNSHGFVKTRGPADLPGIEFASHDTRTQFARAIHFNYIDPNSMTLRGGAYPAAVGVSFYNFLNGGSGAVVDGTPEAREAIEEDDLHVVTEAGARFSCVSNSGTLIAPRLQPFTFAKLQQPRANSWMLYPIKGANTNIPGAEVTGPGPHNVLAFTDQEEVLRVLQPQSLGAIAQPTLLSSSSPTVSAGVGTNLIRAIIPLGNLLYVVSSLSAGTNCYVNVIDVSNPSLPIEVSETSLGLGQVSAVAMAGSYLFISTNVAATGVQVVDVSDPWAPVVVASINTGGGGANGLAVSGNVLFVGTATGGFFRAYNLAALPGVPPLLGSVTLTSVTSVSNIAVRGKYAYVTQENATDTNLGLQIIDIANPSAPVLAGSYDASLGAAGDFDCRGLAISGRYAFTIVPVGGAGLLHVIDIANPAAPVNAATVAVLQAPSTNQNSLLLIGDWLYVAQQGGGNDVTRWDVSNPLLPTLLGATPLGATEGLTLASNGNLLFVGTTGTPGDAAATPPTDPAKLYDNLKILQITGTQQEAAQFGSLRADKVRLEHLDVDRDVRFQGGLNIGDRGLYSKGPIASPTTISRPYTVGTLPAGRAGMRAIVSDATAPAFLATVTGGGAVRTPVFWDDGASAWKVG